MMSWLKKLWPDILAVIAIIVELTIKRLQEIEQSHEQAFIISLIIAILVAWHTRHVGEQGKGPLTPPNQSQRRAQ